MRRRSRRRGSVYVELALVLLPTLALLLAIVDFSLPIFLSATFNHAVREGVRYAITFQTVSGASQTASIRQVVQLHAVGFLDGQTGADKIQVKYYSPTTFVEVTGTNANADGNIVEVSVVGYSWTWMVPVWRSSSPLAITAISSDRLEVLPRGTPRPLP